MTATHLRLRHKTLGGHVHVQVFTGVPGFGYGLAGDLTFTVEEWPNMRELLARGGERVELIQIEAQQDFYPRSRYGSKL